MRFRPDAQVVYRRSRVLLGWAVGCWLGVAIQELLWQLANALAIGRDLASPSGPNSNVEMPLSKLDPIGDPVGELLASRRHARLPGT